MDTQQATSIIGGMMTQRQNEINALQMALNIINGTLQTELAILANKEIELQATKDTLALKEAEILVLKELDPKLPK